MISDVVDFDNRANWVFDVKSLHFTTNCPSTSSNQNNGASLLVKILMPLKNFTEFVRFKFSAMQCLHLTIFNVSSFIY